MPFCVLCPFKNYLDEKYASTSGLFCKSCICRHEVSMQYHDARIKAAIIKDEQIKIKIKWMNRVIINEI